MSNYILLLVALLENLGLVGKKEAAKLADELMTATLPSNYEAAQRMVAELLAKHGIKKPD